MSSKEVKPRRQKRTIYFRAASGLRNENREVESRWVTILSSAFDRSDTFKFWRHSMEVTFRDLRGQLDNLQRLTSILAKLEFSASEEAKTHVAVEHSKRVSHREEWEPFLLEETVFVERSADKLEEIYGAGYIPIAARVIGRPHPKASEDKNEPTTEEWQEIKQLALRLLQSDTLDTPAKHLSYVRTRLLEATQRNV